MKASEDPSKLVEIAQRLHARAETEVDRQDIFDALLDLANIRNPNPRQVSPDLFAGMDYLSNVRANRARPVLPYSKVAPNWGMTETSLRKVVERRRRECNRFIKLWGGPKQTQAMLPMIRKSFAPLSVTVEDGSVTT